jgi:N-glycosylase/DNA lyase
VFTGVIEGLVWQIRWSPDVNDQLEFKVHGNKSFKPDGEVLTKKLVDYLRLKTPLESLYKQWAKSDKHFEKVVGNEKFLGVRILKQLPRENLFSFICSSNNNISRYEKQIEQIMSFMLHFLAILINSFFS